MRYRTVSDRVRLSRFRLPVVYAAWCWLMLTVAAGRAGQPVAAPSARAPVLTDRGTDVRKVVAPAARQNPLTQPAFRWAILDADRYRTEDAVRDQSPGLPMRIGVNRSVPGAPISIRTDGDWRIEPDGARVWVVVLEDPGARAIRVHFSRFDLPGGTSVAVYGRRGLGDAYRARGPLGRGAFWAAATPGDAVWIEFRDPSGRALDPLIEIDEISHIYRTPDHAASAQALGDGLLPCHVDVNCVSVDPTARDAVGYMEFTIAGSGTYKCTGALLNDLDDNTFAGYFLTARHCISTQEAADSLTVYWFYQTALCNGAVPDLFSLPKTLGAVFLGGNGLADSTLLRLLDDPHDGQGLAGWTTDDPPVGASVVSMHHPNGTFKRYAGGMVTDDPPQCDELPAVNFLYHDWLPNQGVMEGGSSGAPLFNANWEVVGQYFGACLLQEPNCTNPQDYNAVSGRFSQTYPTIASFLEMMTPDDALEDNDDVASAPLVSEGVHDLILADLEDYVRVQLATSRQLTASISYDPEEMGVELSLVSMDGTAFVSAEGVDGFASVTADVVPGDCWVRVAKKGGWGGAYSLDIQSQASGCAAASPAFAEPVPEAKNRYISFVPGDQSGVETAIGVRMIELNRKTPGGPPDGPDFRAFEGEIRYVGPPQLVSDPMETPSTFYVAELQCTPFFADWSAFDVIHVYGRDVVPGSVYEIGHIHQGCTLSNPGNYSAPLVVVSTTKWGDIVAPFAPQLGQPSFGDISAIVSKFTSAPGSVSKLRSQLQPDPPNPNAVISFADINLAVSAFQGIGYPFGGPQICP